MQTLAFLFPKKLTARISFLILVLGTLLSSIAIGQSDLQTNFPKPYTPKAEYKKSSSKSFYLEMRDGAKIALDLFLPKKLEAGKKIPTVVHLTRYWRAVDLRWPFKFIMDPGSPSLNVFISTEELVQQGYAVLSVDVRGTGASTGERTLELSPEEVEDGRALLDWVVAQSWSNGKAGALGISYNGWAAQMLATLEHPALKAIVPFHAAFDGYREMSYVGGLFHQEMTRDWTDICSNMDQSRLSYKKAGMKLALRGYTLVDNENRRKQRKDLNALHLENNYAGDYLKDLRYRDLVPPEFQSMGNIDVLFPCAHIAAINRSDVAVYTFSGWYDMSNSSAAIRQFMNYDNPQNKLLLGPWNHGGKYNVSPWGGYESEFRRMDEVLKFFDFHLKGLDNGLYDEPLVHYFHMQEEAWRGSSNWPVAEARRQTWYLEENAALGLMPPESESGFDLMRVDTTTYSGHSTRWNLDRRCRTTFDSLLLVADGLTAYRSPVMQEAVDFSGVPVLTLEVRSEAKDGAVFVYLLDESADGSLSVVSEGQLRFLHRKLSPGKAMYKDIVPYRSLAKADQAEMSVGQFENLKIEMYPTSWRLEPGHRLRLILCGSDRDHYENVVEAPFNLEIHRSRKHASYLQIQIIPE